MIFEGNIKGTLNWMTQALIEVLPDFTMNLGACSKLVSWLHLFYLIFVGVMFIKEDSIITNSGLLQHLFTSFTTILGAQTL